MPYPQDLLQARAVVKPGMYTIIPPQGRVFNVIPGITGCRMTILCTPKVGASFVQIIGTADPNGGTTIPYAKEETSESFLYVLDGEGSLTVTVDGKTETLPRGGYAYAPAGTGGMAFRNASGGECRFLLYKQRYIAHPGGKKPWAVFGNTNAIQEAEYTNMANVFIKDLLPVDEAFDMNMHILSFEPGGSHEFVETHVQEHGAYLYEGEGMYLLNDDWVPVKAEDFIWMGAYCKQCCYAVGRSRLSYIYSKDCHRDVEI